VFKEWKTLRVLKVVGGSEVKSHLTLYYFKACSLEIWWKILLKLLAVNIISFTSTQSKWTDLMRSSFVRLTFVLTIYQGTCY
jgi:hypothetical protein